MSEVSVAERMFCNSMSCVPGDVAGTLSAIMKQYIKILNRLIRSLFYFI